MNVLVVAPRFPYPPIRGDQLRLFHFLRHLRRTYQIILVSPSPSKTVKITNEILRTFCHTWHGISCDWCGRLNGIVRFLFTDHPLQAHLFCTDRLAVTVRDIVAKEKIDVIYVLTARVADAVVGLDGIPKVIDFVDSLGMNMSQRARYYNRVLAPLIEIEAKRMKRYEQEMLGRFDYQIVSSQRDAYAIGQCDTLHVVSNGVDLDQFRPDENERDPNLVVFVGRMDYVANIQGVIYFAKKVFPLVLREVPTAKFVIVGAKPAWSVRRLARIPGVSVTGYVPSVREYLTRASVAVAPLLMATGIQNKVLEAMACGTPVVATSRVLGGMNAVNGAYCDC